MEYRRSGWYNASPKQMAYLKKLANYKTLNDVQWVVDLRARLENSIEFSSADASHYIDRLNALVKEKAFARRGAVPATDLQLTFISKLLDERKDVDNTEVSVCRELFKNGGITLAQASKIIDTLLNIKVVREATPKNPNVPEKDIPLGTYTIVLDGDEDYVTLKVEKASFVKDKVVNMVSYLNGPDNEISYKGFAFVGAHGINVWSKFKSNSRIVEAAKILWNLAQSSEALGDAHEMFFKFAEGYAIKSGRCARCGKTLTVPSSLHRGLGPECAGKEGL